eukprot:UN09005
MTEQKSVEGLPVYSDYKAPLEFDIAVNRKEISYGDYNRSAMLQSKTSCTIRGPFWNHGRHIVNIYIAKASHVGVGIVNKLFNASPGNYLGQNENSYGTWDSVVALHRGAGPSNAVKHAIKTKDGDVVTVDVDLNQRILNFAINGQYLSDIPIFKNIPKEVAIAASLWTSGNSVEILQYTRL